MDNRNGQVNEKGRGLRESSNFKWTRNPDRTLNYLNVVTAILMYLKNS